MTGNKTLKERETEKTRGKKRYIERRVEELEAEKEIKDFDRGESIEDRPDEGRTDRPYGVGPLSR